MIAQLTENAKELLSFLKNPADWSATNQYTSNQKASVKFQHLFTVFLIDIALVVVIAMPLLEIVEQTGLVDMESHAMNDFIKKLSGWQILLIAGVLVPVFEELVFRTFLTFRRNLPLRLLIAFAGIAGVRNKAKVSEFLKRSWRKYYRIIFYVVALVFAFVHITNYEITTAILLFSPLLVLPQFVMGLFTGYMRVKFGLGWSMGLHSIHNILFIGISLWFMEQAVEKLNTKTEAYDIKIEETKQGVHEESSSTTGGPTVSFVNHSLENVLQNLLQVDESLFEMEDTGKASLRLNINFTSRVDTLMAREVILKHLQEVYGLEIVKERKHLPYYVVQLRDPLLLQKHQLILSDTVEELHSTFTSSGDLLAMENVSVGVLAKRLSHNFSLFILCEQPLPGKYNFDLPRHSFEGLEKQLQQEYGLRLVQKEREFEFVSVKL